MAQNKYKFAYAKDWNVPENIPLGPLDCEHCIWGAPVTRNAVLNVKCRKPVIRVLDMAAERCSEFKRKETSNA